MKIEPMIVRLTTAVFALIILVTPLTTTQAASVSALPSAQSLLNQVTKSPAPSESTAVKPPEKEDTGLPPANNSNNSNPYAQLGPNGFDTRPAAPPAFTVPVYPSIESYIVMVINFLLDFLALGVLIMLIYGGFMYTTAMGDSGKQKKAKGIITSSIVGFFLIIVAFAIVATIIAATRPGVNECATPQSGVCISSSGGNVNFGVGAGVGTLLGNIF